MVNFLPPPPPPKKKKKKNTLSMVQISQNIDGFRQNNSQRLLQFTLLKLYKENK